MLRFCSNYCKTNWSIRMSVFSAASTPKWAAFYSVWFFFFFFFPSVFQEDNNTRVLFERVLTSGSLPPEKSGYVCKSCFATLKNHFRLQTAKGKRKNSEIKLATDIPSSPPLMLAKIAATRQVCAGSYPAHIVTFINLLILKPRWHGTDEDKVQNPAAR